MKNFAKKFVTNRKKVRETISAIIAGLLSSIPVLIFFDKFPTTLLEIQALWLTITIKLIVIMVALNIALYYLGRKASQSKISSDQFQFKLNYITASYAATAISLNVLFGKTWGTVVFTLVMTLLLFAVIYWVIKQKRQ